MNGYERAHAKALTASQKRMQAILDKYEAEIARLAATVSTDPGEPFRFADHPTLKARYDRLIKDMEAEIETAVTEGAKTEWGRADGKNDALAVSVTGSAEKAMAEGYIRRNKDALEAFLERKRGGMTLSDRVWMYTGQYSTQIQDAIGIAVQDGTSAAELSREVRRYLQRPDTLFRRVRDEYGVLHLSKNAKAYHPGAGVYRSAYMNARRLAVTEMNMAYRTSDYMRVQQLDFVVGIEVHLSGNHNCKGIPPGQFYDICDELKGKYPKTFKFTGWHPHCRCYTTTILKSREEMKEDAKRMKEGKNPTKPEDSKNAVKQLPEGFDRWVDDNHQRIAGAKHLPYFLKDNGTRNADGVWEPFAKVLPSPEPTPLETAAKRHEARTPEDVQKIKDAWARRNKILSEFKTTIKRAENILNMEKEWIEVDFAPLEEAQKKVSSHKVLFDSDIAKLKSELLKSISDIKAQRTAEKALSDIIPDVHKWHKQFTLAELQEVKDSIHAFKAGKAAKYYVGNFEDLPLAKQKQLFMDEAKYVSDASYFKPHTLHKTWNVAKSAYERQVALVDEMIAWEATDIKLTDIKTYSAANPKSLKIANLIAEAEKIKAAGGSIADVEAKILEAEKIKAKNEASVASHAKAAAQKKAKELSDLQQKKVGLEKQKKGLESIITLAKPTNAAGLTKLKDDLRAVEKELKAVNKKIDRLGGNTFADEAYSEARKKAAVWDRGDGSKAAEALRGDASRCWLSASEHERDMMYDYTRHFCDVNEPLTMRRYGNPQTRAKFEDKVNAMTDYIERSSLESDMWFQRGDGSLNAIESMLKFAGDNSLTAAKIASDPQQLVGKVIQQGAFMSAGSQRGKGFTRPVILNIYAPKGTKATYVEPFSAFGRGTGRSWDGKREFTSFSNEHETLFQRGTKMRVIKVEYKNGIYYIDVDVIGYELKNLKYVPDSCIGY